MDHVQVVVRRAEETLAAPVAGEQHRPEGILLQLLGVEQKLQVFTGGFRIADLELDRLPDLAQFAREDAAAFLVLPEYAADEKITPTEMILVFVDDGPDEKAVAQQLFLIVRQVLSDFPQDFRGLAPPEFEDEMIFRPRDQQG